MSTDVTRKSKRSLIVGLVAAVVVIAAAAGVFAFKGRLFPAKTLATLRAGYLPVTGHAKFFVAQKEGFFATGCLHLER
jgi:ABC-type nitrate/sulfonate/bicarbonate transport system substrate-binding protein